MRKYPAEKLNNKDFFYERKNEFYPDEEYDDYVMLCYHCYDDVLLYYLNKMYDSDM